MLHEKARAAYSLLFADGLSITFPSATTFQWSQPNALCLPQHTQAVWRLLGTCTACGQMYCGGCNANVSATLKCPTCRAPISVSHEENFKRLWKLVHDRSPAWHTPAAQNNLGSIYRKGKGVKQDYKEAVAWYRRAAEQGYANAQYNLGNMYEKGQGVKQDHTEAGTWFRKAAAQGVAAAQCNLGVMYNHGQGVKQDHKEAVKWYRNSAEQGHAPAQSNLGGMYDKGKGVKQDCKEAVEWYRNAAAQGNAAAQSNLGIMYADGLGVPQDFANALKWFQLAAEQGHENGRNALDDMQQRNVIPTPPPGTAVTAILLTSAAGRKHNNKPGIVVTPAEGTVIKPGRVAVLLEGAATPISFKLMNLRI